MARQSYLVNQLLIAMPAMHESLFADSVTYLCEHSDEGAMGIMVNRPSDLTLGDLLEHLELAPQHRATARTPVLVGGPVQTDRGFVLHVKDHDYQASYRVPGGFFVTTSRDVLQDLADGQGPEQFVVALGYAGWGGGQLEEELSDNAWLTSEPSRAVLFESPLDKRWAEATGHLGIDPGHLSGYAGHA